MWYSGQGCSLIRLVHNAICRDVIELAITYTRGRRARGEEQLRHSHGKKCFWNVSDGTHVLKLSSCVFYNE